MGAATRSQYIYLWALEGTRGGNTIPLGKGGWLGKLSSDETPKNVQDLSIHFFVTVNGISQLFRKQKAEASLNPLHFPLALLQNMMAAFFSVELVLLSLKYRNRITPQNIPHMITYNYLRLTTYRWDMAGGLLPWSQVMQAVKEMRKTLETEAVPSFLLYKWTSWTNIVKTVRATPLDLPSRNRTMWGLPIVPLGLYSNHHEY